MRTHAAFGFLAVSVALSEASGVTPVAKVTQLLEELSSTIEKEGQAEAAAYDKYACFCKEEADDKQYAIEKSTEKIARLGTKIGKLTTEISDIDGEIQALGTKISGLASTIQSKQTARDGVHATFETNVADATGAIDSIQRAIVAMKESKKDLSGHVELEASFPQIRVLARAAMAMRSDLSETDLGRVSFLATAGPGEAYSYKYQSNDIIATLEGLLSTFTKQKESLEADEFKAQSAHDLNQQARSNEKKFAEKEKAEQEHIRESKADEKASTEADKSEEEGDKNSDQNFLDVLTGDCQTKAQLWDQRSLTRANEQTAIAKAITALKDGVSPNFKANKKLVGLQMASVPKEAGVNSPAARSPRAASFLQIQGASLRGAARSTTMGTVQLRGRIHDLLATSATKLRSSFLSIAVLKIAAAKDHWVEVRGIIKDLIARLEADADAEADSKSFCDENLKLATTKRDTSQMEIEKDEASINIKESKRATLTKEIAELSRQIAANNKALLEATTLRGEEKAENEQTISDARAGKQAVQLALTTLQTFYNNAFLQYVPPNSDREGLTVGDRAPEVFNSEYHGSQEASTGIIGILEIILSDFTRTIGQVTTDESTAASEFQTFKGTNEQDTSTKEGSVTLKDGQISTITDELVGLQDSLTDAKKDHADSLAEMDNLHSQCIAGVETYKQRVEKRNKEIEALKEAHDILENWQK